MDQKKMSDLDPKLKEAYDRVMGFSAPAGSKAQPTAKPPVQTPASAIPVTPQQPTSQSTNYQVATMQSATASGQQAQTTATAEKPGSKVVPLVFLSAGMILLILYAFFWIRFWNIQIF